MRESSLNQLRETIKAALEQSVPPLLRSKLGASNGDGQLFHTSIRQIAVVIEIRWSCRQASTIRLSHNPNAQPLGHYRHAKDMIATLKKTRAPSTERPGGVRKPVPNTGIVVYVAVDGPLEHEGHLLAELLARFVVDEIRAGVAANLISGRPTNDRELVGAVNND